ncbi:enoyl-CoA hydratase/isomerase family protein [Sphingomonas gilva]|uniref:Enoyl-CoA hydratase/isomerase family protein n=1 Tax=Sphingomonas gilva TaxID=2305907 RepID=A0A396RZT9_9SPHN|nr:enoyl-CoA hydratase-related protein [Sphingomonas gilva]RHW19261.1 enoyl-CoA hydratase/isomerase family protein [Sphingomonas gilva]
MADSDVLIVERRGTVALLRMNRPDARNAVNEALRHALIAAIENAAADETVRALVLTGEGSAFSAGGDIAAMKARLERDPGAVAAQGWLHQRRNTHRLVTLLASIEKPVIAAVNGAAAGLGADLAIACDLVIASDRAKFAYSYILRGLIPDGGGMFLLPRRIGLARAKNLIFTGRTVLVHEALAIGLADEIAAPDVLVDTAVERAAAYGAGSPVALGLAKSILNHSHETSLDDVLSAGAAAQGICYASSEHRQSVTDFLAGKR